MSTKLRRRSAVAGAALAWILLSAEVAHAQLCEQPRADRIDCRFINPTRETLAVSATARLRHQRGAANGAVVLKLDGRDCDVAAARWQLGTGEATARCLQPSGPIRHTVEARVYGVQGARLLDLKVSVQPAAGGLERLPSDVDQLAPARRPHRVRRGLWPF